MKVLLRQNIDRLGRMGEVVNVAGGYARNYLIPRGFAIGVTRGRVKETEEQKRVLVVKSVRERDGMEVVAERIRSQPIKVEVRCSATGKLFGSVTNRQLAQAIEELTGDEIDRHKIVMDGRIRAVGTYQAAIKLHPDVTVDIEFEVQGEGFVPEEPPAEAEEGEAGTPEGGEGETAPTEDTGAGQEPTVDMAGIQPLEGGLSDRPGAAPEGHGSTETGEPEGVLPDSPDPGVDNETDSRQE